MKKWWLLLALVGGCSAGSRSPEGAVRALAEAAADGDRALVWRLLGPDTRAKLESDARHAAELSGRRAMKPEEMLAVGWFPSKLRVDDVRELDREGNHADVEVRASDGRTERVRCVRVSGAWRVELP